MQKVNEIVYNKALYFKDDSDLKIGQRKIVCSYPTFSLRSPRSSRDDQDVKSECYYDFTARPRLSRKDRDYGCGYRIIRIQGGKDESLVVRDWNRALKKARITLTNSAAYVLRLFAKESCLLEISGTYMAKAKYVGYVESKPN